jgi:CelD/BcsL family acetyltransferase involved in cellulose biosynthesis
LPEWLKVWWEEFRSDAKINILSVRNQEAVIGLAPLQVKGDSASFIGGTNVCDYLDFIVTAGKEGVFFDVLLDHLGQQGIKYLELGLLRPDSTVLSNLVKVAENRGCEVSTSSEDITLELELPATWEDYLGMLNGKQRHEVKRKLRRLYEAGDINFRVVEDTKEIAEPMATFFELFKMSSNEKAAFMTDQMISFFQALASAMATSKILKLYILELNGAPVAVSMCFDFNATLHLYNSGYDPRFRALSVGLLCKVLTIKDGIKSGRKKYDFLKGAETYKYRLGGREVPLYNCRIQL